METQHLDVPEEGGDGEAVDGRGAGRESSSSSNPKYWWSNGSFQVRMTKNAIGFRDGSVGDDHVSLFFIKGVGRFAATQKMKIAETNKHERLCLSHEKFVPHPLGWIPAHTFVCRLD